MSAAMEESAKVGFGAPIGYRKITPAERKRIDKDIRDFERRYGLVRDE